MFTFLDIVSITTFGQSGALLTLDRPESGSAELQWRGLFLSLENQESKGGKKQQQARRPRKPVYNKEVLNKGLHVNPKLLQEPPNYPRIGFMQEIIAGSRALQRLLGGPRSNSKNYSNNHDSSNTSRNE